MRYCKLYIENKNITDITYNEKNGGRFNLKGIPYRFVFFDHGEHIAEYISRGVAYLLGIKAKEGFLIYDEHNEKKFEGYAIKEHLNRDFERVVSLKEIYDVVDKDEKHKNTLEATLYCLNRLKHEHGYNFDEAKVKRELLKLIMLDFICGNEQRDITNIQFVLKEDKNNKKTLELEPFWYNRGLLLGDKEAVHYIDMAENMVDKGDQKLLGELKHKINYGFLKAGDYEGYLPTYEDTMKELVKEIFKDDILKMTLQKAGTVDPFDIVDKILGKTFKPESIKLLAGNVLTQRIGDLLEEYGRYAFDQVMDLKVIVNDEILLKKLLAIPELKDNDELIDKIHEENVAKWDEYINAGDVFAPLPKMILPDNSNKTLEMTKKSDNLEK